MAKPEHPERNGALEDRNDLPEGWIRIALQDVVSRIADGSHNPPKKQATGIPMLSARNIENGRIKFEDYRLISPREFESESKRTHIEPGDVLLTIVGSIGRSAVVPQRCEPFALQRSVAVLKPVAIDPGLLMYELRAPFCQSFFEQEGAGTAQKGIYLGKLATLPVLLPPQAEQKRIIAKIEGLTARVEASLARLAKVPAILKRFRQSVLAAACSGRLTAAWRESHPDVEPASNLLSRIRVECEREDTSELKLDKQEIPDTWAWSRFGFLMGELRNGISTKPNIDPPGTKILRISSVRPGAVSFSDVRYLPKARDLISAHRLRNDDLLFTRYNGSLDLLGVCGMVRVLPEEPLLYPDKLMRVRFDHAYVLPAFIEIFFQSPEARDRVTEKSKSSAGQQGVSGADIKAQHVALPPIEEQREIVRRVEALFKLADAIEKRVAMATVRTEKLTQSILAKAFRGELVPTEAELARREGRDYESASALLTRIRSEIASKAVRKEERNDRASAALLS